MKKRYYLGMIMGLSLLCGYAVQAEETVRIDCDILPITDEWVEGTLGINEYHYYPIEISGVGKLTVTAQSFFDYYRVDILDADLVSFATQQYIDGSAGRPATVDFTFYVDEGTYYVRCTGEAGREGEYRVKALFEEVESTEEEPNDDYKTAQPLQEGVQIQGVHTRNDEHDYYMFEISERQDVSLTIHVPDSSKTRFNFYDDDMVLLDEVYDGVAFAEEKTYVYSKNLEPGVYYIDMTTIYTDEGVGPYWIRWGEEKDKQQMAGTEAELNE